MPHHQPTTRTVTVAPQRWARWLENFAERHGGVDACVRDGSVHATAPDGSHFEASLPFDLAYDGPPDEFAAAACAPPRWGVLLVRKGGFAVARLAGVDLVEHKIGRRHVQGRTKAGGQSQQRFARRRANQARQANEAAAEHAARILHAVPLLVTGGDRGAVAEVLSDARLAEARVVGDWLPLGDPRRSVLDEAIERAQQLRVQVTNAPSGGPTSPIG